MKLVFVGERRSATARGSEWTWEDGRLCAATLHRALERIGLDPTDRERVRFCNLFVEGDGALALCPASVARVALAHYRDGWMIVALGQRVAAALARLGIHHLELVHPAARGAIRKTARYQAHVAAVLGVLR